MGIYIKLTKREIDILNEWLKYYSDENKDATHTGIYAGIKYTLDTMWLYWDVVSKREGATATVHQETIDRMIDKMNKNSVNAMWNLGLASGICWTLELFNVLQTNNSGVKQLG